MQLFEHQKETMNFFLKHPRAFCTSTPGTGKTVSTLAAFNSRKGGKMLVIAPKSTLEAVWKNDIEKFFPHLKVGVFSRSDLKKTHRYMLRLLVKNDVTIFNIQAADLLLKQVVILNKYYDTLVIDEFTSIKNRTSQRSKRMAKLVKIFKYRYFLSGTPTPNGIIDIWHPALLLDDGVRLGANFFYFRNTVCQPILRGRTQLFTEWVEITGAADIIGSTLKDITIRHELEKVQDMPQRVYRTLELTMPASLRSKYEEMRKHALLQLKKDDVLVAVNKAVLSNKLLQMASGAVYGNALETAVANVVKLDTSRYELITQLIKERQHSIVFYIWKHQREAMEEELKKEKITYEIIAGSVSGSMRAEIIKDYQAGKYQTLLIQPQAAAHGITLTRSSASIWCSPTWNLEHFIQANFRDYRIGQNKRTEVIMIQYKNTIEQKVYAALQSKGAALDNLLEILQT